MPFEMRQLRAKRWKTGMDVLEDPCKKVVLLGNEAIERGAPEAGVGFAAFHGTTRTISMPLSLAYNLAFDKSTSIKRFEGDCCD